MNDIFVEAVLKNGLCEQKKPEFSMEKRAPVDTVKQVRLYFNSPW